jgi:hypothetical protein
MSILHIENMCEPNGGSLFVEPFDAVGLFVFVYSIFAAPLAPRLTLVVFYMLKPVAV